MAGTGATPKPSRGARHSPASGMSPDGDAAPGSQAHMPDVATAGDRTSGCHGRGAMPEGHDAIRIRFDADEPPAIAFNDQAHPGALVSWAWCQLTALDSLLQAITEMRQDGRDDADIVGAVRSVLVPAINALAFSDRRAQELQNERAAPAGRRRKKKRAARARA